MNELLKVNDNWIVKGTDTTSLANFTNKFYKGSYVLAKTDNPNKFVLVSPFGTNLHAYFSLYVFTLQNGSFIFVIYEIYNTEVADQFTKDIEAVLPHIKTVIGTGDEFHDFNLRVNVDKSLVSKLIERVNNL